MKIEELIEKEKARKQYANKFLKGADEFAFGHYGSYDWRRNLLRTEDINLNLPFLRTVEGKDHTLFIIDIDIFNVDDIKQKVKYATVVVKWILKRWPKIRWLIKYSGSSFHLIQKYDKRINPNAFYKVMGHIFSDWNNLTEEKQTETDSNIPRYFAKIFTYNDEEFEAGVDHSLTDRRHLISGVYSEYAKEEGLYSRPIEIEELDDPKKLIENSRWMHLEIKSYDIPPFQFESYLGNEIEIESQKSIRNDIKDGVRRNSSRIANVPVILLPKTKKNDFHLKKMKDLIKISDWKCIRKAVKRAREHHGVFFGRAPIARFLWWNYKKDLDLIAYYFYYEINNDTDNKPENWRRMEHGINYAIYNKRGDEKSMDTWHSENILRNNLCEGDCEAPCKRFLWDMTSLEPIENFASVMEPIRNIIRDGRNMIIKKTTRAGVTSSTVLTAIQEDKRIMVICPTNAIASETFYNISLLAHQMGLVFTGAVIGSNTKLCLKCMEEITRVRESFASSPLIAIDKLPFLLREKCRANDRVCEFFDKTFPNGVHHNDKGIPTPVLQSSTSPPRCAFATIFNYIYRYNVIFMTYDKIRILIHQLKNNKTTEEIDDILIDLLNNFDVILLDEVSRFINNPSSTLALFIKKKKLSEDFEELSETVVVHNILKHIRLVPGSEREDWDNLLSIQDKDPFTHLVDRIMDEVDEHFTLILNKYGPNTWGRIRNPVSEHLREEIKERFNEWYSRFVDYAKQWNFHFPNLLRVMELISQPAEYWYITNIPKGREVSHVEIKIRPFYENLIDFIRLNNERGKQILITDATMPYVDMNELFKVKFKEYNLGDPRKTCQLQLIIPDTRNIYPRDLTKRAENNPVREKLITFINNICETFDSSTVMIIAQNKDVHRLLIRLKRKGQISAELDVSANSKQLSYYRSSATIGVANERRIMIVIGSPFPPKNSYIWMAKMLKSRGLFKTIPLKELSEHLLLRETSSAFFQTIGRCKDPFVAEPSIVFCYGISTGRVKKLMNDLDIPKPHIVDISKRKLEEAIKIGEIWKESKIYSDEFIYDSLKQLNKYVKDSVSISQLPSSMRSFSPLLYRIPIELLSSYELSFDKATKIIRRT